MDRIIERMMVMWFNPIMMIQCYDSIILARKAEREASIAQARAREAQEMARKARKRERKSQKTARKAVLGAPVAKK